MMHHNNDHREHPMTAPADIQCLCLDVDGVLTEGLLLVNDDSRGARLFDVHDGFAIRWFQKLGGAVLICTGKTSPAVAFRAEELGIAHVVQGSRDKLTDVHNILKRMRLHLEDMAMIGDDLPDLPVLRHCGYPIAVANAAPEIKAAAQFVTERTGGRGAVREAIEHLMRPSGRWDKVVAHYERLAEPR
jgi:3-deoxy-D-manno-octulosonate 8-phosphate phosphatase (KDO 8-P phosphatase)